MPAFSTGGGVSHLINLEDTPPSYVGHAKKALVVNAAEDAVLFYKEMLPRDGSELMTGDLNLGSHALRNASEIEFITDYAFTPLNGYLELVNKANNAYKDLRVGILDIQGGIDMNQKQLIDLPTPALDSEAATKKYHDDNLSVFQCSDLSSCSIANLGTKDHHLLTGLGDDDHTIYYNATRHTKAVHDALGLDHGSLSGLGDYDHDQYLRKSGAQAMGGDLSMGTHKITNLVDPVAIQDAATKKYIHDNISIMYASDETTVSTAGVAYALAKHFWIVHAPGQTPDFNTLMFVVYAANDTVGKNTYVAIYEDAVKKVELTFAFAAGGVYTRQFAELDISGWVNDDYHIELKMKVDAGSTGHQWAWESWMKDLAP